MKTLLSVITLFLLQSCGNLPNTNDILSLSKPIPLSNLKNFNFKVINTENSTIVQNHIVERSDNHFKTSLISNIRDPKNIFDGQYNDQKLYNFVFESDKPLNFDNLDSIFITFNINFNYRILNYKDSMVFIKELNREVNILMTKENNILFPVIEFAPFNDPDVYEVVYTRYGVNEQIMKKYRELLVPVHVRISILLKSYLLETNVFPFVYAETDYDVHFQINGYY